MEKIGAMESAQSNSADELTVDQASFLGTTSSDHKPALGGAKGWIAIITFVVLIYPIAFVVLYPQHVDGTQQQSSQTVLGLSIQKPEDLAFVVIGLILILLNFAFIVPLVFHLLHVRAESVAGIKQIRGMAAPGGAEASHAVDDALEKYRQMLSWRHLFMYIGQVTLAFYFGSAIFWLVALIAPRWLPDSLEPATRVAHWVLLYYGLAFVVRMLLRWWVGPDLRGS